MANGDENRPHEGDKNGCHTVDNKDDNSLAGEPHESNPNDNEKNDENESNPNDNEKKDENEKDVQSDDDNWNGGEDENINDEVNDEDDDESSDKCLNDDNGDDNEDDSDGSSQNEGMNQNQDWSEIDQENIEEGTLPPPKKRKT